MRQHHRKSNQTGNQVGRRLGIYKPFDMKNLPVTLVNKSTEQIIIIRVRSRTESRLSVRKRCNPLILEPQGIK